MALYDRDGYYGHGNVLTYAQGTNRLGELTDRLRGKHPDPVTAAKKLLSSHAPVVSLRAGPARDADTGLVTRDHWTSGIVFARTIVRRGLRALPSKRRSRTMAIPIPEGLLVAMRELETERMVAIFADSRGRMLSHELVAEGDHSGLRLSLRQIFSKALMRDARRMVLAHNHPSGSAEPSESDIASTRRLNDFANSLGIALEDHLIIGKDEITSMRGRHFLS